MRQNSANAHLYRRAHPRDVVSWVMKEADLRWTRDDAGKDWLHVSWDGLLRTLVSADFKVNHRCLSLSHQVAAIRHGLIRRRERITCFATLSIVMTHLRYRIRA